MGLYKNNFKGDRSRWQTDVSPKQGLNPVFSKWNKFNNIWIKWANIVRLICNNISLESASDYIAIASYQVVKRLSLAPYYMYVLTVVDHMWFLYLMQYEI